MLDVVQALLSGGHFPGGSGFPYRFQKLSNPGARVQTKNFD
jgi:hypothetical protein